METKLFEMYNTQLNFELESANIYLNMALHAGGLGMDGFKHWFEMHYQEEIFHANKLYNYMLTRGKQPYITAMAKPATGFNSIVEMLEVALEHEKKVTENFQNLMKVSRELSDYSSESLISFYLTEQIEEEALFQSWLDKAKLVKDAGLYMLDQEAAKRVAPTPLV